MLAMIHEAGFVSWLCVFATVVGLVGCFVGVRGDRPVMPMTLGAALFVVAVALLNTSVGQHKVDAAVQRESDPERRTLLLSLGTREASSNLFVGGTCVVVLLGGALVAAARRRP